MSEPNTKAGRALAEKTEAAHAGWAALLNQNADLRTALAALVAALRLLDSMVRSGEAHSDQSELVVKKALAAARRLVEEGL